MTIADYFSKLKYLWDEFDALMPCPGCPCPESKKYSQHFEAHRLMQFLVGLNETYAQARSQIMMMSHVPSINKAYSLLVDQESQRSLATCQQSMLVTEGIESTALYSNIGNGASGGNYKFKKSQVQCEYCHCKGHIKENCYKLIGYPPDFKTQRKGPASTPSLYINGASGVDFTARDTTHRNTQPHCELTQANAVYQQNKGGYSCVYPQQQAPNIVPPPQSHSTLAFFTKEQYQQILQLLSKGNEEAPGSSSRLAATCTLTLMTNFVNKKWIIDTGASNHTTSRIDMLNSHSSINKGNKNIVHLPNGEMVYVTHKGEATILKDHTISNMMISTVVSNEFTCLLTTLGIMHQSSCVYTPQQNIVVERKHRTILEMARCLRFQASIPLRFWGECVTTIVYLINRLPFKVIGYNKPFEVLYLHLPSLHHLRVFGCLCYASSPKVHDKFSPRAIPTVLMGHSSTQKRYILYDLSSRTFLVNKNVIFQENIYPLKHIKQVGNPLFPVLEFVLVALDNSVTPYYSSLKCDTILFSSLRR
ncbi:uncharacterized protein LOC142172084 [Nicotiana tabacum]|uniref:Uncharacterized protein LOC142172084 n=1 Tax=Nicotiana tabacum TaxID=4097 RepID=A0AC58T3Z0_TOBAC